MDKEFEDRLPQINKDIAVAREDIEKNCGKYIPPILAVALAQAHTDALDKLPNRNLEWARVYMDELKSATLNILSNRGWK